MDSPFLNLTKSMTVVRLRCVVRAVHNLSDFPVRKATDEVPEECSELACREESDLLTETFQWNLPEHLLNFPYLHSRSLVRTSTRFDPIGSVEDESERVIIRWGPIC